MSDEEKASVVDAEENLNEETIEVASDNREEDVELIAPLGNSNVPLADKEDVFDIPKSNPLFLRYGATTNAIMIIGFLVNFALLLFSHLGVSAVIFSSLRQDGVDIEADFIGACSNFEDLEIIAPGQPLFDEPNVVGFTLGNPCATVGDPLGCFNDAVNEQFGASEDCSTCLFAYTDCLRAGDTCFNQCRLNPPDTEFDQQLCEECSDKFCEFEYVVCTGINVITDRVEDACVGDPDFNPGSRARDQVPVYLSEFNELCFADESYERCVKTFIRDQFSLGDDCAGCLEQHSLCIFDECRDECSNPVTNQAACEACIVGSPCENEVEVCTGVSIYGSSRRLQEVNTSLEFSDDGACLDKEQFNIFEALELTFVESISKAAQGGSIQLALLIGLASGVWPYTKIILMIVCWYVPLRPKTRKRVLRVLSIAGKWSLVDVFAVVLITNGILVQKILLSGLPLVLFAEPRAGIYAFGIAAILALAQGEIIRVLDHIKDSDAEDKFKTRKVNTFDERTAKSFNKLKGTMTFLLLISLVLSIAAAALIQLEMTTIGLIENRDGPNEVLYAGWNMSLALINECALHDRHGSVPGAVFLAILFFVLVVVIPIVVCTLMLIASLLLSATPTWGRKIFFAVAFGLSNFAALDVWCVTLFVFSNQFAGLIRGAVGDENVCGLSLQQVEDGEVCIGLEGSVRIGGILLPFAVLTFWIAQCAAARLADIIDG